MSFRGKLEDLERRGTPIRVGLVGVGQMGRGFIAQVGDIPGMEVVAAADMDLERTLDAFRDGGRSPIEGSACRSAWRSARSETRGRWRSSPSVTETTRSSRSAATP